MGQAVAKRTRTAPKAAPKAVGERSRRGKTLSLVIPMHNEAPGLDVLFARIDEALGKLGVKLEIVCVDDGSRDDTFARLKARAAKDRRLRVASLARNFGKEAALTAGLELASGHMVVPIDADLQDPPELVAEFVALWEQGFDVVYGVRSDRSSDTAMKRFTSQGFYRLFNLVADHPIPPDTGDFRLMDRAVVEALKALPERNRFMKGLFAWVGFRQVGVPYVRPARAAGTSSWGYVKLIRFAVDGVTSFSTAPLRVWTLVGIASALLALVGAAILIVRVMVVGRDVPGYASLMVALLVGFAFQMVALGVMGEYLGRMYQEVKGRPIYMIRERAGFGD
jgi:glycosyltransferase involved in cell wall biosynthesis